MELTELVANEAVVYVPVGDEKVEVRYKPAEITQDIFILMAKGYDIDDEAERRASAADEDAPAEQVDKGGIVGVIPKIVKWWDVTRQGENVAVTDENVRRMPLEFLRKVIKEILADSRDDEGEAESNSSDG